MGESKASWTSQSSNRGSTDGSKTELLIAFCTGFYEELLFELLLLLLTSNRVLQVFLFKFASRKVLKTIMVNGLVGVMILNRKMVCGEIVNNEIRTKKRVYVESV